MKPEIVDAKVDDGLLPRAPNGDDVGFVSLNQAGDKSGSFHPSANNNRRIVARSMIDNFEAEDDPKETVEITDTFDAAVVEVDVSDYLNGTGILSRQPKVLN